MALSATEGDVHQPGCYGHHGRADDAELPQNRQGRVLVILVKSMNLIGRICDGFFAAPPRSPILRIVGGGLSMVALLALTGCSKQASPTQPSGPPQSGSTIVYAAVGASDVAGIGSSVVCVLQSDCPNGTGYVFVAARGLRGRGFTVNLLNLGLPTGVISRTFQDLGSQYRPVVGNFIDQEVPFVQRDTTLITVFAGANEVNIITSAFNAGAGGSDPVGYIDQMVRSFGDDFGRLMNGLRAQAPAARIVILNVPNVGAMPFQAGASLGQRQAAQRAAVRMTTTVVNGFAAQNVSVIDLMCDSRFYSAANYSSDGFHPNDVGYAAIGNEIIRAVTEGSYATPLASCAPMSSIP
jgi:lysophospholipase L1-like esterase